MERQTDLTGDRVHAHMLDVVPLPEVAGNVGVPHGRQRRQPARVKPVIAATNGGRGHHGIQQREVTLHPVLVQAASAADCGQAVSCARQVSDKLTEVGISMATGYSLCDSGQALPGSLPVSLGEPGACGSGDAGPLALSALLRERPPSRGVSRLPGEFTADCSLASVSAAVAERRLKDQTRAKRSRAQLASIRPLKRLRALEAERLAVLRCNETWGPQLTRGSAGGAGSFVRR